MRYKLVLLLLAMALPAAAGELEIVAGHCQGIVEHVLPDRTRVDCLTDDRAIEYDYGRKWAEAIGQSLHYAAHTGRRAGIVLITTGSRDELGFGRARRLIDHYGLPITLERLGAD